MEEREPYEKPAVIFEDDLEAQAGACGDTAPNIFLGAGDCKGEGLCVVLFS